MLRKKRFYYFSDKTLGYHEVKFFKTKTIMSIVVLGFAMFGMLFVVNYALGDPLGINQKTDLISENRVLRNEVRELTQKSLAVQKNFDQLVEWNNQVRLMVNLSPIDKQTQQASIGGSLLGSEFSFLKRDAASLLSQSNEVLSQLEREVALQKKSYEDVVKKYEDNKIMFQHLPAIKPCDGPYSLSGFGMRIHPVLGVWRMHEGLDIINEEGTPVYASGNATVFFAGRTQGGYGTVIELNHGYGYSSLYAHLSQINVREGQKVRRGELIGRVGRSGLVSGPHLHYEVRLNGRKQNPVDFFFDDVDAARYRSQLASAK